VSGAASAGRSAAALRWYGGSGAGAVSIREN
jgi:hypothetical protein